MASDDAIRLLLLVILILLSAFFSCAEASLTAVSRARLQTLAEEQNKRAVTALQLTEHAGNRTGKSLSLSDDRCPSNARSCKHGGHSPGLSRKTRSTILLCKSLLCNFSVFLTVLSALQYYGPGAAAAATGILTPLILIFGILIPRKIAEANAESFALGCAPAVAIFSRLLTPVLFILHNICGLFLRLAHVDPESPGNTLTELELRTFVDVSHKEGVIEKSEREMIYNVVDFGDSQARDVMVPRADMVTVSEDATYEEIMEVFRAEKYTRLPVYREDRDNIIGILNIKDFFFVEAGASFDVTKVMYKPYFTYEFKKTSELLMEMQKKSVSVSIVLDEYGSAVGMISIEDLLEEIVGEIRDEYDEDEKDQIQAVSELEYLIEGSVRLDDINDALGLSISSEDYDSIGGLIIEQLDHLPLEGETVTTSDNITLTVEKMDKTRIELVRMVLPELSAEQDAEETDASGEIRA